jgi:hypothetical protein
MLHMQPRVVVKSCLLTLAKRLESTVLQLDALKLRTFKVRLLCERNVGFPSSFRYIQLVILTLLHAAINTQIFLCLQVAGRFSELVWGNPCSSQEPTLGRTTHNLSFYCLKSPISQSTKPCT